MPGEWVKLNKLNTLFLRPCMKNLYLRLSVPPLAPYSRALPICYPYADHMLTICSACPDQRKKLRHKQLLSSKIPMLFFRNMSQAHNTRQRHASRRSRGARRRRAARRRGSPLKCRIIRGRRYRQHTSTPLVRVVIRNTAFPTTTTAMETTQLFPASFVHQWLLKGGSIDSLERASIRGGAEQVCVFF